ncbi:MAG: hypothetical protein K5753_01725 [Clostridia bacterium]|nr:hypothetical protein [Clostridia bacterium]
MEIKHRVDMFRYEPELQSIIAKQGKPCDVLFYGSSTFGIWKEIEEVFKDYRAINAGFGGSTSDEALFHYERVAKPFCPKVVVWYYGDNEPVCSYTAEESKALFLATWDKFRKDFPGVKIVSIATKTSFARDEYKDYVREMNDWQREQAKKFDWLTFIETADLCKDEKGEYIFENYLDDKLHFGPKAYAVIEKRVKAVLDSLCVS